MAIERKKYFQRGGKWIRETSYWHEDTQNCSTAFEHQVSEDEVPAPVEEPEITLEPTVPATPPSDPVSPVAPPVMPTEPEPQAPIADVQTSAEQQPQ